MRKALVFLVFLTVGCVACSTDDSEGSGGSGGDATVVDRGSADMGIGLDSGPTQDTGVADAGVADLGAPDMGIEDAGMEDTGGNEDTGIPFDQLPDFIGEGACTNASDLAVFEARSSEIETVIGNCVTPCILTGETCYTECVRDELGLTDECAACFGAIMQCTATNCMFQCMDATNPECETCRDTNCSPAFEECSGLPSSL